MFHRIVNYSKSKSFFLFGARGTGKTFWIKQTFKQNIFMIDLLNLNLEDEFTKNPMLLEERLLALNPLPDWVIIDEIQKIPQLLDVVHRLIESHRLKFVLTGSSARKLKRGAGNLLAGRAFINKLFPLTYLELKESFVLDDYLNFGGLPEIYKLNNEDRQEFLRSYSLTYLKEEIQTEQLIRNIPPFRKFLEIAAQTNGQILNYSKIARELGLDHKTVQNYYQILEETLVGFFLPSWHKSVRKQQISSPRFYLFDLGVKRALENSLTIPLNSKSADYGYAYEHFIILQIIYLSNYYKNDWSFYYLKTKDGQEIDLIIERPGLPTIFLEIKSSTQVSDEKLKPLIQLSHGQANVEAFCFCQEAQKRIHNSVKIFPWQEGIKSIFAEKFS